VVWWVACCSPGRFNLWPLASLPAALRFRVSPAASLSFEHPVALAAPVAG